MRETHRQRPAVTVATIVARDDAYLLVEEHTGSGLCLNQPAGHVEAGESLTAAAVRETLEETRYAVTPVSLVGIYRWEARATGMTFLRFAFAAEISRHEPQRPLDRGIVRALWLPYDAIVARRGEHRSPLVLRCLDDYRAGRRLPLDLLTELG
jgi:8-oxo-dGTP pyrophosphatase MutT (NUDIX family)